MRHSAEGPAFAAAVSQAREHAYPLGLPSDLDPLLDCAADARLVLIGDASHGTHDFYALRATITRQLVARLGFSVVAVEADAPDCEPVGRSVRLATGASADPEDILREQRHWPSWLWANTDTVDFCRWLREHNSQQPSEGRAGWYGLDTYPLWSATAGALDYLEKELGWPPTWVNESLDAPLLDAPMVPRQYIGAVAARLASLVPTEEAASAAAYYHDLFLKGDRGRAVHWLKTLGSLLDDQGGQSRAVVWAHNTHVGDASGTNMSHPSFGQLVRERYGQDSVLLVGMTGGSGSVMAARQRGAAMSVMDVAAPRPGSLEALLEKATPAEAERALFLFPDSNDDWLVTARGHRAIGAVYNPSNEVYVPTSPGLCYDAMIWCGTTSHVEALHVQEARSGTLPTLRRSIPA